MKRTTEQNKKFKQLKNALEFHGNHKILKIWYKREYGEIHFDGKTNKKKTKMEKDETKDKS